MNMNVEWMGEEKTQCRMDNIVRRELCKRRDDLVVIFMTLQNTKRCVCDCGLRT